MMNGLAQKYYCDSNGNVSNSGTLTLGGSYGAWAQASLWTTTYWTGNQPLTWMALISSNNITHSTNTDSFQVSQAGTYAISCYVYISTIASGAFQLIGRYSTNGSTW